MGGDLLPKAGYGKDIIIGVLDSGKYAVYKYNTAIYTNRNPKIKRLNIYHQPYV